MALKETINSDGIEGIGISLDDIEVIFSFCFVSFIAERDAMLQRRRGSSCERSSAAALALDPPRRGLPAPRP
jgi:hypothetical protein